MGNICNCDKDEADGAPKSEKRKLFQQAGGHAGTIEFHEDKLIKVTKESEAMNYQAIFDNQAENSLTKMRPLVSEFYWAKK